VTGAELKAIRHRLGLSTIALGRALGYEGSDDTASVTIRRYESDARPIPPWIGRLAEMFDMHGVPAGWTSRLPKMIDEPETPAQPEPDFKDIDP
jgi:hypothetical protein